MFKPTTIRRVIALVAFAVIPIVIYWNLDEFANYLRMTQEGRGKVEVLLLSWLGAIFCAIAVLILPTSNELAPAIGSRPPRGAVPPAPEPDQLDCKTQLANAHEVIRAHEEDIDWLERRVAAEVEISTYWKTKNGLRRARVISAFIFAVGGFIATGLHHPYSSGDAWAHVKAMLVAAVVAGFLIGLLRESSSVSGLAYARTVSMRAAFIFHGSAALLAFVYMKDRLYDSMVTVHSIGEVPHLLIILGLWTLAIPVVAGLATFLGSLVRPR